jgi:hypothetical protein
MRKSRFLCLAVSRRDGGNCIAGIDIDSGQWIRPVNAQNRGAFGDFEVFSLDGVTQKRETIAPLDVLELRLDRNTGNNVQPENWEMAPLSYDNPSPLLRRFDSPQDAKVLLSYLDLNGPLLHSYSNRISSADPSLPRGLSHSLSIIGAEQLYWKVTRHPSYANKLRVEAEFRFDDEQYCLVATDPIWEARCRRFGLGRHPHAAIAGNAKTEALLTISLAEKPLNGYHYKLVAAVIHTPA